MENRWEWKFTQMNSALDMAEGRISVLKETPVETIQSEAWIQKEKGDTHTHTHTREESFNDLWVSKEHFSLSV